MLLNVFAHVTFPAVGNCIGSTAIGMMGSSNTESSSKRPHSYVDRQMEHLQKGNLLPPSPVMKLSSLSLKIENLSIA
jgi:hypothetical protein